MSVLLSNSVMFNRRGNLQIQHFDFCMSTLCCISNFILSTGLTTEKLFLYFKLNHFNKVFFISATSTENISPKLFL